MSEPRLQYVGNRNPAIFDTIMSGGSPQDLQSMTVKFRMRAVGSSMLKVDAAASFVNPPGSDGKVTYAWAAGDVDTEGLFLGWWVVTDSSGKTQDKPEFLLEFRAHAPKSGDLVELVEVRQAIELREVADEMDDQIRQLITLASERIQEEIQRELLPTDGATRTRQAHGHLLDFAPYDLRSASSVVLDPNGSPKTLVANTDYRLQPSGADRWGVYTELKISDFIVLDWVSIRFGVVEVQIVGNWGMASVPAIAKQACITTVRSWLRRDSARAAYTDPEISAAGPDASAYYALPPAARNMLRPLYRDVSSV